MKLKNLKQSKKQTKKQQVKAQVQQKTKIDDDQQQRDDALIDIKQDIKKKQQPKPKINKRVETNKLQEQQIDTSKILIDKKQQTKKPISSWVVQASEVKDLLKEDFKLKEVQDQFQSLTDTKLNEQIKQKKQQKKEQQKTQTLGQMKFAPLNIAQLDNKNTDKLTFSKPAQNQPIGLNTTPALNFTNSKLGGNMNVAPLQKSPQLYDDDIEKKMQQRMAERSKIQAEQKPVIQKGKGWFKQPAKEAPKQAPKIQFKSTPLAFTNTALQGKTQEQQFKGFQPIQKSKQQQIYDRKEQQFKFTSKKQQQERKKKRQEEQKLKLQQQAPTQTQ